jgi:hypothetical protein
VNIFCDFVYQSIPYLYCHSCCVLDLYFLENVIAVVQRYALSIIYLFQGCKSETEPIKTKSVVQNVIRCEVWLAAYYKADTKYCSYNL